MSERFEKMEACARAGNQQDRSVVPQLCEALQDEDWRVRYTAAIALGDLQDASVLGHLLDLLQNEDAAPLYTQPEEYGGLHAGSPEQARLCLPENTDVHTTEAWRRRGRVKQAVCFAIAAIGQGTAAVRAHLERYVVDEAEDYMVRAAAARALGTIGTAESLSALESAAQFNEWCTRTEAAKALKRLRSQE